VNKDFRIIVCTRKKAQRAAIQESLEKAGFITWGTTGTLSTTIKLAKTHMPDLILFDADLPDVNVDKICEVVKNDPQLQHIDLVLISDLEPVTAQTAAASPQTYQVIHPCSETDLIWKVNSILRIRRAESQLEKVQTDFNTLIANNPDGILIVDQEGHVLFASPAAIQLLQRPQAEIIGQPLGLPISGDDSTEIELLCGGGKRCLVEMRATEIEWQGQPAWLLSLRDITIRKQTENALQQSENRYRLITGHVTDIVWQLDSNLCFTYVSPAAEQVLGYTHQEAEQLHVTDLMDSQGVEKMSSIIQSKSSAPKAMKPTEYKMKHKDGHWVDVEVVSTPILNEDQQLTGFVGITRDVTQRIKTEQALQRSENLLNSILQTTPAAMGTLTNRVFTYVNDFTCTLTGYSREELLGQSSRLLYPSQVEYEHVGKEKYQQIRQTGTGTVEAVWKTKDGRILNVLLSSSAINPNDWTEGIVYTATDITERKRAEAALRKSEARFRTLIDKVSNIAIQGYAPDGTVQFWNKASEDIYGYTAEEAMGRNLVDIIIPPEMRSEVKQAIKQMTISGEGISAEELILMRKDGSPAPVYSNHTVIDVEGQGKELFCIDVDLAKLKRAEEALRKSERNYREIFNATNEAIAICEAPTGKLLDVNDSTLHMYGYDSKEEILSGNIGTISANVEPYTQAEAKRNIKKAIEEGPQTLEWLGKKKNGQLFWVEVSLRSSQISGEERVLAVARDISERKRAEEALRQSELRYETLTNISPVGIFRTDANGKTTYVNPRWCKISGISRNEALGDAWMKAVHPDDRPQLTQNWDQAIGTGNPSHAEYRFLRPDESIAWVMGQAVPEKDINGKIIGYVGTITDITERKIIEEILKERDTLLDETGQLAKVGGWEFDARTMKGTWTAEVARIHDVDPNDPTNVEKGISFYRGESRTKIDQAIQNAISLGKPYDLELELVTAKGIHKWVRTIGHPIKEGDQIIQVRGSFQDITDLHKAEEALRQSEERFRRAIEEAPFPILIHAEDGEILSASRAWTEITGYPKNEIATISAWTEKAYGVRKHQVEADIKQLYHLNNRADEGEYIITCKDGSRRTWDFSSTPLGHLPDGRRLVISMAADVTERQLAEEKIKKQISQLEALRRIDATITASTDLQLCLDIILGESLSQLKVDAADILLLNPHLNTLEFAAGKGFRTDQIEHTSLRLGEGYAGQAAMERRMVTIHNLKKGDQHPLSNLSLSMEDFNCYYGIPLIVKGKIKGVLEIFVRTHAQRDESWIGFLESLAGQAAIAIESAMMFDDLQHSNLNLNLAYDRTLEGWSRALDLRDREAEGHTQRVAKLTVELARRLNVPEHNLPHIRRGALLHDIGKMGIPDRILFKPGKLTDEEWKEIRKHPTYAQELLSPISYLRPALDIPYCHHERWDGSGYPRGLQGEQIPLAARIFAVVDVWDALISDKPYRTAWSEADAIEHIRQESGHLFDPRIAEHFLHLLQQDSMFRLK
jgi:PAS domain S-box-containing protein